MKSDSLINQLERFFAKHTGQWFYKADLTRKEWYNRRGVRYSTENVGRRLRELEEASFICVKYDGINAKYRYIPIDLRRLYKPSETRVSKYSNDVWREEKEVVQGVLPVAYAD